MKMKAAVLYEQGLPAPYAVSKPYKIEMVDLEGPGDDEVLVEIRGASLCHSDLGQAQALRGFRKELPIVPGHEGAGVIVEVGRNVREVAVGDHVIMAGVSPCGHCEPCYEGKPELCGDNHKVRSTGLLSNGACKMSIGGKPVHHFVGVSTFAQYSVCTPASLIKVPKDLPLDIAPIFGCAVLTGVGAVMNSAKVRPEHSVAIIGLGGVGLSAVMAAKLCGAENVIGIDILDSKFPLAKELGCTATVNARDPEALEKIRDLTRGGVHFAFELTGIRSAVAQALDACRRNGEVIGIGLGSSSDRYDYSHVGLVTSEKAIRGSMMGGGIPQRDIPRYIRYFQNGRLPVDRLISGHMDLEGLNPALDALEAGAVLRQVVLPHQ